MCATVSSLAHKYEKKGQASVELYPLSVPGVTVISNAQKTNQNAMTATQIQDSQRDWSEQQTAMCDDDDDDDFKVI